MDDILHIARLRKYYYQIYFRLNNAAQWIKTIYNPSCLMTKTHLSPIIFSVRKIAKDLLKLADKLEDGMYDYRS